MDFPADLLAGGLPRPWSAHHQRAFAERQTVMTSAWGSCGSNAAVAFAADDQKSRVTPGGGAVHAGFVFVEDSWLGAGLDSEAL